MNKTRTIVLIAAVLCIVGLCLTILDFLALNDIHNEYISTRILQYLNITISGELPTWTATKGEWDIVRISLLIRLAAFIFCVVVLFKLGKRLKTSPEERS